MKLSIRTKFALGMVFIFLIILGLLGFSAYSLTKLSKKTNAILRENHVSVVYARDMTENLMILNQKMINSYLVDKSVDATAVDSEFDKLDKTIHLELNNITETGEDKLAASINSGIIEYHELYNRFVRFPKQVDNIHLLENKFEHLHQQLTVLSQMNEKAIERKTDDAKISAKNALMQLSVIGSFCFLIALSFIYSFASYFNERFFQLYNGIKEIVSSNFGQRLYFDGNDEFYEISLLFNQMAGKLEGMNPKMSLNLSEDTAFDESYDNIQELKDILIRIKAIELQAVEIISTFDKMK
jgi:methyl-accepting chemotaxis protein